MLEKVRPRPERPDFGSLLRRFRVDAGLSQEALAERARISVQGVGALERGTRRTPRAQTLELLIEALGLDGGQRRALESAARPYRTPAGTVTVGPWMEGAHASFPTALTSFVGREQEVAEIVDLVGKHRLVTLTGPGGIGKTRTALEAAMRLDASFAGAVVVVELASLVDPDFVASAVAAALDVQEVPGHPLVETIALRLQSRGTLLLLDNCEHVVAEAARVVERLVRVASLRVLATSREPLRVAGERIYRLLPLGEVPAIELFEDRARAVKHDFALGAETLPLVARICERLGNLPLAIELAAARVTALSVASIAEMLEHRFALLAGGSRTSSGRQQTMRGTIAWSYELLAQPERRVFERLSVFAGGCTLECAVAVCAGEDCARADVFDLISSLVDKSLVIADLEDSSPRYGMLEPFREYAREQLAARGELDPTQRRHALVWLEFAMQLGYHSTAATRSWHSLARAEHENLRVALEWTLVGGKDAPLGGRIVAAFTPFWLDLAAIEGLRWVQLALAGVDPQSEVEVAARLERTLARLSLSLGDLPAALEAARRAEERFRTLGDRLETGRAQGDAAAALVLLGRPAEAEPLVLLALEASRETGHALTMAKLWLLLAEARAMLCDFAGSRAAWSEAMSHAAFGAARNRGPALVTGAEIEFRAGEVGAAIRLCSEALACCGDDAGNAEIATTARANLAAYHVAAGRLEEARGFARAALLGARETGLALQVLWSVQHLGAISVLRSCGGAATQEHLATGARLLGFVDAGYEALGALRHTTEQQERDHVIAVLGATLAREDCEAQLARGAMLGEDQAIALALEV